MLAPFLFAFLQAAAPSSGVTWPTVFSVLGVFGVSGAIAFILRYGTRLTVAEMNAQEAKTKGDTAVTKTAVLESRVNQQDTIIAEIRSRLGKLDEVPKLVAASETIAKAVEKMEEHLVPRNELDQRFSRVESDLATLKEHLMEHLKEQR